MEDVVANAAARRNAHNGFGKSFQTPDMGRSHAVGDGKDVTCGKGARMCSQTKISTEIVCM
jgi:hypothetical protein